MAPFEQAIETSLTALEQTMPGIGNLRQIPPDMMAEAVLGELELPIKAALVLIASRNNCVRPSVIRDQFLNQE